MRLRAIRCPFTLAAGSQTYCTCNLISLTQLKEKPDASLCLIEDVLEDIARRRIAVLVTQLNGLALLLRHPAIVREETLDHVEAANEVVIIICDRLQPADVSDAAYRGPTDLSDTLSESVDRLEDRLRLLVEQQMVVSEQRARKVPVEFFVLIKSAIASATKGLTAAATARTFSDRRSVGVAKG